MSITQEETPEIGSLAYWLLVGPALLLPATNLAGIGRALIGRARTILIFGLTAGAWHLARGDLRAVQQIFLIVWVLAWLSSNHAGIAVLDLVRIYIALVIIGACIWLTTDINNWGLLPNTTTEKYIEEGWRISFFPNIANTAMLSFAVFLVLTKTKELAERYNVVLAIVSYFLIFSFVRTATIGLVIYLLMRWWMDRKQPNSNEMFWTALVLGVGINLFIASSAVLMSYMQQFEFISRLFLRGETDLTADQIFAQLYRPWLWMQHLELFWTSPSMMGLGAFDFVDVQIEELNVGTTPGGNEALLTRLLANYGLPALLFLWFYIARLREAAQRGDQWTVACFPAILLLMMQWGTIFHPSDANGAIFTLIAIHGHAAFFTPKIAGKNRIPSRT